LFGSCHPRKVDFKDQYYREFYSVLNSLIQFRFTNLAVVVKETMPVYKNIYGEYYDSLNFENPPPPPPPGIISYDKSSFEAYIFRKFIDSVDAVYMYNSIDSSIFFELDSTKLIIPVIDAKSLSSLFDSSDRYKGYEKLDKIYGKHCYIVVSTPIFNSNYTKVIISIDRLCGPLSGQGHEFILEKRNGKWYILSDGGTWVS
jgi:hypothetical protein